MIWWVRGHRCSRGPCVDGPFVWAHKASLEQGSENPSPRGSRTGLVSEPLPEGPRDHTCAPKTAGRRAPSAGAGPGEPVGDGGPSPAVCSRPKAVRRGRAWRRETGAFCDPRPDSSGTTAELAGAKQT